MVAAQVLDELICKSCPVYGTQPGRPPVLWASLGFLGGGQGLIGILRAINLVVVFRVLENGGNGKMHREVLQLLDT